MSVQRSQFFDKRSEVDDVKIRSKIVTDNGWSNLELRIVQYWAVKIQNDGRGSRTVAILSLDVDNRAITKQYNAKALSY